MKPEQTEPEYTDLSPKKLAEIGIFTPLARGNYDDPKRINSHWVVLNQKIVSVDPDLPGLQDFIEKQKKTDELPRSQASSRSGEVIPRPPALENSLQNFFRSFFDLLAAWFRWLFGGGKPVSESPVVSKEGTFSWSFEEDSSKKINFKIVRASECPNDKAEFGKPSVNVLLSWEQSTGQGNLLDFAQLRGQTANHFISNPQPPNHGPNPPMAANERITKVYDSDFQVFDNRDKDDYAKTRSDSGKEAEQPIVAVMDTGLKYKWNKSEGELKDSDGNPFQFNIAEAPGSTCLPGANFGYCSIDDYMHNADSFVQLAALRPLTNAQIKTSPYDDHLVDESFEVDGQERTRERVGRHGTYITAILNRNGCQVLPVKAFNCAARGTLFDVLDGLNYLIAQKRAGMPIRVLNASFGGELDGDGLKFFYEKMKALTDLGVWVVASSGNEGISLDGTSIYPAQFGLPQDPYSLEKVITVNSFYSNSEQGNTGAAVSLTARSPREGGFPSAIGVRDSSDNVIQGTSFAAPYVACALAQLDTTGLSKAEAIRQIVTKTVGEVEFNVR